MSPPQSPLLSQSANRHSIAYVRRRLMANKQSASQTIPFCTDRADTRALVVPVPSPYRADRDVLPNQSTAQKTSSEASSALPPPPPPPPSRSHRRQRTASPGAANERATSDAAVYSPVAAALLIYMCHRRGTVPTTRHLHGPPKPNRLQTIRHHAKGDARATRELPIHMYLKRPNAKKGTGW